MAPRICQLLAAGLVGVVVAGAPPLATQSVPPVTPAYPGGQAPIVAIDEAHKNTHTASTPSFRGLVELLRGDGYRVQRLAQPVGRAALDGIGVLVICGPGGWQGPEYSLSPSEIAELTQWVRGGGSVLLILDHRPTPAFGAKIAEALGVSGWHDGYAMVEIAGSKPIANIVFWRADALPEGAPEIGPTGPGGGTGYQGKDAVLAKHVITEGRTSGERVRRVAAFGGSAFRAPAGMDVILTLPARTMSLVPPLVPNEIPVVSGDNPRIPVGGWAQGGVLTLGKGRVALFAESGMFSGGPAADNRQFVLNLMHWLTRLL